jgi:hypothetical protein
MLGKRVNSLRAAGCRLSPDGDAALDVTTRSGRIGFASIFGRGASRDTSSTDAGAAPAASAAILASRELSVRFSCSRSSIRAFAAASSRSNSTCQRRSSFGFPEPSVSTVRPPCEEFFLFLGEYIRGDVSSAIFHADQITSDSFQLGLIARALAAVAKADSEAATRALSRLVAVNPAWRDDTRGTLAKFLYAPAIVDRLASDLAAAGLAGRS